MVGKLTRSRYPDELHAGLLPEPRGLTEQSLLQNFSDGYVAYLSGGIYVSD